MAKWQDSYRVTQRVEILAMGGKWVPARISRKTASGKLIVTTIGDHQQTLAADRKSEIRFDLRDASNASNTKRAPTPPDLRDCLPELAAGLPAGSYTATATSKGVAIARSDEPEQLVDVVRELGILIECRPGARKPPADLNWKPAQSWTCTLSRMRVLGVPLTDKTYAPQRLTLVVDYYGGSAVRTVHAADIVGSLCSDAVSTLNESFEGWCASMDQNPDSRAAERVYNACRETAEKIRTFLGEHFDRCARAEH